MDVRFRAHRNRSCWAVVKWIAVGISTVLVVSLLLSTPAHSQGAVTSGGYTTSATVSPASVSPGATANIAAVVSSQIASKALVDIEVYNGGGTKLFQQYFDNQTFTAGAPRTFTSPWAVPAGQPSGTYTVRLGIFSVGWGALLDWNNSAAQFTVGATTTTTKPTTTTTKPTTTTSSTTTSTTIPASSLAPLPAGWPTTLQLGMADSPGGAAAMAASTPFSFRYQYLSGGANTGSGWATWNTNGQFVTYYIAESQASHIIPVFTYYQLLQSAPGNTQGEPAGDLANLTNTGTMTSYYQDLTLFFQRAAAKTPVVLHVEPDLWAYLEQQAQGNNASTVPVQVASTGNSNLSGLPNTAAGFAQAFVRLRNKYAPNVILAYHFSTWGTGTDILYSKPPELHRRGSGRPNGTVLQISGRGLRHRLHRSQ